MQQLTKEEEEVGHDALSRDNNPQSPLVNSNMIN